MKPSNPKPADPKWHLIDAEGANLGRLSVRVANILRGKDRPTYCPNVVCGDHVVIINAQKLLFHPTKHRRKVYVKHTGYLGHLKSWSLQEMIDKKPTQMIEMAVKGMLPKNRLAVQTLKRLHVFAHAAHTHEAQQPVALSLTK